MAKNYYPTTEVNHPASDITTFTYDALGNVITKQTANLKKEGKTINYEYDYGRLTAINYPDHPENNVKYQLDNVRDINYRTKETPTDSTNINNGHKYTYDANGNLVYINTSRVKKDSKEDEKTTEQKYRWDEKNRLLAADENGFVSNYWYDADGERTVKTSGENEAIYVNSEFSGGNTSTARFSLYVSPYLVAGQGGKYTKHIYVGSQRIVSKLGDLASYGADPRRIPYAGNEADGLTADYKKKYGDQLQAIQENYRTFDIPYNGQENDDYVNGQGRIKDIVGCTRASLSKLTFLSFAQQFCCNDGTPEAAQARVRTRAVNGNFKPNDDYEKMQFYYHPDHLGSSSYITNLDGEVAQHIEYVPFGEVFIEERNNTWNTPYLFNAKEFDEETGLYYYGARYYELRLGLWMSADPKAEKFPKMSPYAFSNNNPISYVDIDGFEPTPYPKALLGSVDYYKWRYNDFIKQNPGKKAPSYYLNYGNKYIQRFTNETNNLLFKQDKQWLVNARKNLQVAIEDKLKADPTIELRNGGNDFKEFAFDSHIDAYWNAGLYRLNTVDLVAIVFISNFKDLMSKDGFKQATKMIDKLINYWLDNPKEGF